MLKIVQVLDTFSCRKKLELTIFTQNLSKCTTGLKEIFDYYKTNASLKIAQAIRKQILEATKQLQKFPESGPTECYLEKLQLNHRYLVVNNYKISENQILINDVFDVIQSPDKMITKETK